MTNYDNILQDPQSVEYGKNIEYQFSRACKHGDLEFVESCLINDVIDISILDEINSLNHACENDHHKIVYFLFNRASKEGEEIVGNKALNFLKNSDAFKTELRDKISEVENIDKYKYKSNLQELLTVSCAMGDLDFVKILLGYNEKLNITLGVIPPIKYAEDNGYEEIANILHEYSKNPKSFWIKTKTENSEKDKTDSLNEQAELYNACKQGNEMITSFLLQDCLDEIDVNKPDEHGNKPLFYAYQSNNPEVIKLLLEAGATVKTEVAQDVISIEQACRSGDFKIVKEYIDNGGYPDKCFGRKSLLHYAAKSGNTKVVKLLLEAGAKPDFRSIEGISLNSKSKPGNITPLGIAVKKGNLEVVKELIDFAGSEKAGVDIFDTDYKTPLLYALSELQNKNDNRYLEIAKELINKGADINLENILGITPIHFAAEIGNLEFFEILLNKGADLNLVCRKENNILHYAVKGRNKDIVARCLEESNVDITMKNQDGYSPIAFAVQTGDEAIISQLISQAVNLSVLSGQKETSLLHEATFSENINVLKILLKEGLSIDSQNINGETPLHYAVKNAEFAMIDALLKLGAKIDAKDKGGLTPFDYAITEEKLLGAKVEFVRMPKNFLKENENVKHIKKFQDITLSRYKKSFIIGEEKYSVGKVSTVDEIKENQIKIILFLLERDEKNIIINSNPNKVLQEVKTLSTYLDEKLKQEVRGKVADLVIINTNLDKEYICEFMELELYLKTEITKHVGSNQLFIKSIVNQEGDDDVEMTGESGHSEDA